MQCSQAPNCQCNYCREDELCTSVGFGRTCVRPKDHSAKSHVAGIFEWWDE